MEEGILAILWLMIFSVGLIVMIVYIRKYTNIERMAIIEKGGDPILWKKEANTSIPLRFSLLLIGGGLGLFVAYFLDMHFHMEEVAYFSMLLLFSGIGLGLSYIIEERKEQKQ